MSNERIRYCSNPNKASIIKMWDDDKPVYIFRMEGDFSIDELRDILIWADQEIKRR